VLGVELAGPDRLLLASDLDQLVRGVLANCLEQAVAQRRRRPFRGHQTLVDQRTQEIGQLEGLESTRRAHGLGGLEVEPAHEDRETAQHVALRVGQ
jgi:hypothetical protein